MKLPAKFDQEYKQEWQRRLAGQDIVIHHPAGDMKIQMNEFTPAEIAEEQDLMWAEIKELQRPCLIKSTGRSVPKSPLASWAFFLL